MMVVMAAVLMVCAVVATIELEETVQSVVFVPPMFADLLLVFVPDLFLGGSLSSSLLSSAF